MTEWFVYNISEQTWEKSSITGPLFFLNRRELNSLDVVNSDEISISYKYFWIIFYCRSSSRTGHLYLSHVYALVIGVSIGKNIFQKGHFLFTLGGISKFNIFVTQNYLYFCPSLKIQQSPDTYFFLSKSSKITFLLEISYCLQQHIRGNWQPESD